MTATERAWPALVASSVAYDVTMDGPGIHRGLPSTELALVVPVGEPLRIGRPGEAPDETWSQVAGLQDGPVHVHHGPRQRGVQVGLTPEGVRRLLGVPAAALAGELLTLDDLEGAAAQPLRELPARLADASPRNREGVVGRALRTALARREAPPLRADLRRALALLSAGTRVQDVAGEVGLSRRRLSDLVAHETGVTPARWRQLARLGRARALLGRVPLAEVALRSGYSDQAHLTRQWRELTGTTPSRWIREEFPFVQDLDAGGG